MMKIPITRFRLLLMALVCLFPLAPGPALAQSDELTFEFTANTGDSYPVLVLSARIDGVDLEPGDEIGVFTSDGLCVGAARWKGEKTVLAAWKDDSQTTKVDGFTYGQPMSFQIWDESEGKKLEVEFTAFEQGNGYFGDGASAVVNLQVGVGSVINPGDVDGDGTISAGDAILVLRFAADLMQPTAQQSGIADVDGDGAISAGDAILVLRKAAGLIESFR